MPEANITYHGRSTTDEAYRPIVELEAPLPSIKLGLRTAHLCIDSLIEDVFSYSSQLQGIETQVRRLISFP